MKEKTCVFIGHNECSGIDTEALTTEIIKLINFGITDFLCGGMGSFDFLCAGIIKKLKENYSQIKCILVIPYITNKIQYDKQFFDEVIYPEYKNRHFKARIIKRNRYMVDISSYAICYIVYLWGGAAKTFQYAEKQNLKIINIINMK